VISFTPVEETILTIGEVGWVESRTSLDDLDWSKFLLLPGLELDSSAVQPVAHRHAYCPISVVKRKATSDCL
jgi:hypothetical protein